MRRGFTLIELLVVIAIIAILAAILFPVFAKAREKARQSSCLSNVRQMTTAFLSYAQDYDEALPVQGSNGIAWLTFQRWYNSIMPYLKSTQIEYCPSSQNTNIANHNYGAVEQVVGYLPWGGCAGFTGGGTTCSTVSAPRYLGTYVSPAERVMVADASEYTIGVQYWNYTTNTDTKSPGGAFYWVESRHNLGANCGFVDGHAKWLPATSPFGSPWVNVCAGPITYYRTD
jgi:prepilin-type N-terminal cleavage/methylation domain-containing protein/prepilin-type processing-associated H-X9-DG protein